MKRYIILIAALVFLSFAARAEGYMVVNTEKVFKSIESYQLWLEELDKQAETYQAEIDEAFELLEQKYNEYQSRKQSVSSARQQEIEQEILEDERRILDYQEKIFGQEGVLYNQRVEAITPIQEGVKSVIDTYAQEKGYTLVLDVASSPIVFYYSPTVDKTEDIIAIFKIRAETQEKIDQ